MKKPSSIGAGPLMVIDTEVDGSAEVEAGVKLLGVVDRRDARRPLLPTLP